MAYGDFKNLARRTASDEILRDKAFNIAKNSKYDGYQRGLAPMVFKFFDKKPKGSGVNIKVNPSEQIAEDFKKIETLKKEQFILDSKTIYGMLI